MGNYSIDVDGLRHRVDSNHHKSCCAALSIQFDHNAGCYKSTNRSKKYRIKYDMFI